MEIYVYLLILRKIVIFQIIYFNIKYKYQKDNNKYTKCMAK